MGEFAVFGLIALIVVILIIVLPIVALSKIGTLRWELNQVKKELDGIHSQLAAGVKAPTKSKAKKTAVKAVSKTEVKEKPKVKTAAITAKPQPVVSKAPEAPAGPTFMDRLVENFKQNWIVWVAGVSLAFGGVFIVQFGIENGLLGPVARVVLALLFGAALIAGAEYLRRKSKAKTVPLFSPVTALAAGGVASLFGAVVSAHTLYDLTSPLIGFLSMAAVAWLAIAGGIIYGPVLAVIGILGAYFSPLLVNAEGGSAMMYAYFLLVLAASLVVERMQRWIWLSALSVACAYFWGGLLHLDLKILALSGPYFGAVVALVVCIPAFGLLPKWEDNTWVTHTSLAKISTQYPTVLANVTAVAGAALIFLYAHAGLVHWQIAILTLLALAASAVFLCRRAQNLDQLAAIFGVGLIAVMAQVGWDLVSYSQGFANGALRSVVAYFPFAAIGMLGLLALGLGGSLWRAGMSVRPTYWHIMTAALPLIGFGVFYVGWEHSLVRSPLFWSASAVAVAGYLTALAAIMVKRGQMAAADILGTGAAIGWVLAAFIAMAFRDPWLTIVLAALAGVAYVVVARYGFRWLAIAGVGITGIAISRVVIDPGWLWAVNALILPVLIVFIGVLAIFGWCLRDATRRKLAVQVVQFETATLATLATLFCVALVRWAGDLQDYTICGIYASLLGVLAMVQLYRRDQLAEFKTFRNVLARVLTAGAGLMLALAVLPLSPLVFGKAVGFFPLDSIVLAYVLPAVVLAAGVYFAKIPLLLSPLLSLIGAIGLGAYTLMLEIRHFWHGSRISLNNGVYQNELYSYTIVMLIATIVVFVASVRQNSLLLRRIGLALAGATALKVFLWDISELRGLGRATSFIGLGLTLAALGWVHQTYAIKTEDDEAEN